MVVCRAVGTQFNDCYTQAMAKYSSSVMIWGTMSSNGTAGLFFLPIRTTMNGVRYHKIHECNMFIQDSAPCHHSKLVSDFLD